MNINLRPISIVTTTFNRAMQLYRHLWTLDSQSYPHDQYRVIVIDDGSLDDTAKIMDLAFDAFPNLNLVYIRTTRKRGQNVFGGQGIAYNIGIRYAIEWASEYVFLSGGDILIPSYGLSSHMAIHLDPRKRAWAIASQFNTLDGKLVQRQFPDGPPDPASDFEKLVDTVPDVLCGPRQAWIRPDRESIGENAVVLAQIPDRYNWQPAESLLSQPEALTLEQFPNGRNIYIGFPGDRPIDAAHPEWPTWQSCKALHWANIKGWDEAGSGHFWEDESLRNRLLLYSDYLFEIGQKRFVTIVHPFCECFHQPHIRQLSFDNRQIFLDNVRNFGWDVNNTLGPDGWGKADHIIVRERN